MALQALGAEAIVCAPPDQDFVDLLARIGVPLAPAFSPVREWIESAKRSKAGLPEHAARMIAAQYEAIGAAATGCDAVLATGLVPSAAAAQCVAEKLGVPYFHATELQLRLCVRPEPLPSCRCGAGTRLFDLLAVEEPEAQTSQDSGGVVSGSYRPVVPTHADLWFGPYPPAVCIQMAGRRRPSQDYEACARPVQGAAGALPSASSMLRRLVRAQRPHFGLQPRQP